MSREMLHLFNKTNHFVVAGVKVFRKDETTCSITANLWYFFVGCGFWRPFFCSWSVLG
jgi:hypothetical protein